jgi:hypothetical protein
VVTRRGRAVTGLLSVIALAVAAFAVVLFVGGRGGTRPSADGNTLPPTGGQGSPTSPSPTLPPPPELCPLTGLEPASGQVPNRPALAVKIENLPAARPQIGLSWADVVYEEPVEASITRFIAVYQCHTADRIEPVRSARFTDADILTPYGHPLFASAGGVPAVFDKIHQAGIIDVTDLRFPKIYHRDPNRPAPHNLYVNADDLYQVGRSVQPAPEPVFTYSDKVPDGIGATSIGQAHVPFSSYSDVFWKWDSSNDVWLRFHGTVPHTYSDGKQVKAKNVIVQVVKIRLTDVTDVNGVVSPEVIAVGSGKAYVLRNGKMIPGTWVRSDLGSVTRFLDSAGDEIPLDPGATWVELLPSDVTPTFG